jgi:hypothetical protein
LHFEDRTEKPEIFETEFCALLARESTGNTDIFQEKHFGLDVKTT